MTQTLQLFRPIPSVVGGRPYPADTDLKFFRTDLRVYVVHPDNSEVARAVEPDNVKRIDIRGDAIHDIIALIKSLN